MTVTVLPDEYARVCDLFGKNPNKVPLYRRVAKVLGK